MRILTFDIEDWYHILDNPQTKGAEQWCSFESRLERNMEIIFNILKTNNQKATFFVVGWIAEKHPNIIKRISDNGFEIGSHTYYHQLVYEQSPTEFNLDLQKSINILEDITSKKVKSFRAPGFSITSDTLWAFEALIQNKIEFDCSVFPSRRAHGGFSDFGSNKPSIIQYKGMSIKEFPINPQGLIFGKEIIYSGGGYFRLLPYGIIKKFTKKSNYVMTYFHPRDFDSDQPMAPGLSLTRKFKSYYGLASTEKKLNKWLSEFSFIDLNTANNQITWENQQIIHLK
jgi:polysaccharide deacetylase family protein (PEP-CTERM system associated)